MYVVVVKKAIMLVAIYLSMYKQYSIVQYSPCQQILVVQVNCWLRDKEDETLSVN